MASRALLVLRSAVLPALCIAVAALVTMRAATGENGVTAFRETRTARAAAEARKAELDAHKAALRHRVALLDPRHVDPDLADEMVRRNLGVIRPDEVVIPLPSDRPPSGELAPAAESD